MRPSLKSDRGQILILAAFSMVMVLSIAALSIDAAYMYSERNRLYAAADAAAKAAAIELHRSGLSNLQTFAYHEIAIQGINPAATGTTVAVNHPPLSGPFMASPTYVEVILSRQTSTFFGSLLGWANLTPGARAVAGIAPGVNCIVTLATPPTVGIALGAGGTFLDMPGCDIADGGSMTVGGGSMTGTNAGNVSIGGVCSGCAGQVPRYTENVPVVPSDPLSALTPPANPGMCTALAVSGTMSISAGCYSSITMANNSTLLLGTGEYYLTGPITTGNSPHICLNAGCTFDYANGVLIYLAAPSASIDMKNGAQVVLNAQTSGPYNGILFYQDPADTNPANFRNGSSTYNLSGALYFPGASLDFGNGGGLMNDCALIVAQSVSLGGGHNEFSNACGAYGGSPLLTVSMAE